uniref:Uncharacterized protein n=1 Tax=Sinocyclocheilus rhinocerous TaxID=307959 RepID=A0A673NFJ0_9TELE
MSSRALSHDSIFITDQTPSTEPTRVLSQENVHGKIKALQVRKFETTAAELTSRSSSNADSW